MLVPLYCTHPTVPFHQLSPPSHFLPPSLPSFLPHVTVSEIEDDFQVPLQGVDKAVLEKVRR